jgi:alkanesulfonate monooxygenase SsuD/methylene tetrahydromethanopterin reductase-like flavin-dependent oxidoreductase (luciferase family)
MRFGVSVPNAGDPSELVELAVAVERSGWDGFFLWDHLNVGPDMHDPWVLLGGVAVRTHTLRLGTLVTPVPRRRPWKLAKEMITLDHLSHGRAALGVGLGVPADSEYGAFGEPTSARVHAARLDEALPLIDAFLRGDAVDHDGEHFQVHTSLTPAAVQRPRPPIWVAATLPHRRPVMRAKRWDGIFPLNSATGPGPLTPAELSDLVADLDPPEGYDVITMLTADVPPSELADAGATWAIEGPASPRESISDVRRRVDAGPPG